MNKDHLISIVLFVILLAASAQLFIHIARVTVESHACCGTRYETEEGSSQESFCWLCKVSNWSADEDCQQSWICEAAKQATAERFSGWLDGCIQFLLVCPETIVFGRTYVLAQMFFSLARSPRCVGQPVWNFARWSVLRTIL